MALGDGSKLINGLQSHSADELLYGCAIGFTGTRLNEIRKPQAFDRKLSGPSGDLGRVHVFEILKIRRSP